MILDEIKRKKRLVFDEIDRTKNKENTLKENILGVADEDVFYTPIFTLKLNKIDTPVKEGSEVRLYEIILITEYSYGNPMIWRNRYSSISSAQESYSDLLLVFQSYNEYAYNKYDDEDLKEAIITENIITEIAQIMGEEKCIKSHYLMN